MEAFTLACETVPGLRHDMTVIKARRNQARKDMDGLGRWGLTIPDPILPLLQEYKPELFQDDGELAGRAWLRFIKHPDSKPFRVSAKQ
jgi:hypothetical protein